jgi:hypothetical protein
VTFAASGANLDWFVRIEQQQYGVVHWAMGHTGMHSLLKVTGSQPQQVVRLLDSRPGKIYLFHATVII